MTLTQMVTDVLYHGAPVPEPDLDVLTHYTRLPRPKRRNQQLQIQITDRMRREAAARARATPQQCQ